MTFVFVRLKWPPIGHCCGGAPLQSRDQGGDEERVEIEFYSVPFSTK